MLYKRWYVGVASRGFLPLLRLLQQQPGGRLWLLSLSYHNQYKLKLTYLSGLFGLWLFNLRMHQVLLTGIYLFLQIVYNIDGKAYLLLSLSG